MKTFLKKISSSKFGFFLKRMVGNFEFTIMGYYHDEKTVALLKAIAREDQPFLLNPSELYNIYAQAKYQNQIDGDYAEVGVFKGATAKAICEAKSPDKILFLFDTFKGLPDVDDIDREMFTDQQYVGSEKLVRTKLTPYDNVTIYSGYFPAETGIHIEDRQFSLVHLDVDIYRSTKESLDFFYPRLSVGGVIVSHDYHATGVRQAFDEFCAENSLQVMQLSTSQCIVRKY